LIYDQVLGNSRRLLSDVLQLGVGCAFAELLKGIARQTFVRLKNRNFDYQQ